MGASFDDVLTIDKHECLSPAGPTGLTPGETMVRLDVWVFQKGDDGRGACVAFKPGPFQGERWTTNPDPHDNHFGLGFRPGEATGMGLMVWKSAGGETIVDQWSKKLQLK